MMMMKGHVDDNMSNLTCASGGEASVSSGNNIRAENGIMYPQQHLFSPSNETQPAKKKRNLPGNPDPGAEVIALSPKSLMATNKFVCEICNKGFQRDQNLQLHRRGHNLPWKLKQRTSKEVIKKVYVCPEPSCVHHDPARALGDLTGIKKHFFRKHGEKKWKCEKCSKRYAVQSDWKAHSKTCGTREYRCDCGTLFSRRDSFITHRAFCDALAEETARSITGNPLLISSQPPAGTPTLSHLHYMNNLHLQQSHGQFINNNNFLHAFTMKKEEENFNNGLIRHEMPAWLASPGPQPNGLNQPVLCTRLDNEQDKFSQTHQDLTVFHHENLNPNPNPSLGRALLQPYPHPFTASSHMSATALLQKAAQMGATMSANSGNKAALQSGSILTEHESPAPTTTAGAGAGAPSTFLQEMMASLSSATNGFEHGSTFEDAFSSTLLDSKTSPHHHEQQFSIRNVEGGGNGDDDNMMTRDFLSLRPLSRSDILSIAGTLGSCMNTSQSHDQESWQG